MFATTSYNYQESFFNKNTILSSYFQNMHPTIFENVCLVASIIVAK